MKPVISPLKLELVDEKKSFFNHFTHPKVFGFTLLLIAIPTFFILPFQQKEAASWFFTYFYFLLFLAFVSLIISIVKYLFKYDYNQTGSMILESHQIQIERNNELERITLPPSDIILYYNSIRNNGFHFLRRDFAHSGISELVINDKHFKILISNEKQLIQLKRILASWHKQNFPVSEFTRTAEKNRLKNLELIP